MTIVATFLSTSPEDDHHLYRSGKRPQTTERDADGPVGKPQLPERLSSGTQPAWAPAAVELR
nr:hypothetical protein [Mycobacterium lepraemurium]